MNLRGLSDALNGGFELLGSIAVWANVWAINKDKGYAGTRLPMLCFFTSWSIWNLYFYPHLGQVFSFYCSLSLTTANAAVVFSMLYYGRKQN